MKAGSDASALASRLRLSNEMRARLKRLRAAIESEPLSPDIDERALRRLLYTEGADAVRDMISLSWAKAGLKHSPKKWMGLRIATLSYKRPKLPVDGNDLQAMGLSGARLGEVIKALEAWWIDEDFAPTRDALLARAKSLQ